MAAQSESLLEARWLHCRERERRRREGWGWWGGGGRTEVFRKGEGRCRERGEEEGCSAALGPTAASARECDGVWGCVWGGGFIKTYDREIATNTSTLVV